MVQSSCYNSYPCSMKTLCSLFLFLFFAEIAAGQQTTSPKNTCVETPASQRQMNDCAAFEYQQADAQLNRVYRKALQYMTDDLTRARQENNQQQIKYEETAIASLKETERTWLSYRDIQCKAAAQQYEGGSMAPMIYSQCLKTLTEHRTADLKSIYEDGDRKLE